MPRLSAVDRVLDILRILGVVIMVSVFPIATFTAPTLAYYKALPKTINDFIISMFAIFYFGAFLVGGSQFVRRKVFPRVERRFYNIGPEDERRTAFQEEPDQPDQPEQPDQGDQPQQADQPDQPEIAPAPERVPLEDPNIPQQRVRIMAGVRPRRYLETAM